MDRASRLRTCRREAIHSPAGVVEGKLHRDSGPGRKVVCRRYTDQEATTSSWPQLRHSGRGWRILRLAPCGEARQDAAFGP
jgi:hypothetical protein